jgi:hypothetical protein
MILEISYTAQDFLEASKITLKNRRVGFITVINTVILLIIALLLFASPQTGLQSTLEIFFGLFILSISYVSPLVYRLRLRPLFKESPYLSFPTTYEITDEAIKIKRKTSNEELRWEGFIGAEYSERILVWFVSPIHFYILPKHSMSEENWNELLKMTKAHIEKVTGVEPQAPQERR